MICSKCLVRKAECWESKAWDKWGSSMWYYKHQSDFPLSVSRELPLFQHQMFSKTLSPSGTYWAYWDSLHRRNCWHKGEFRQFKYSIWKYMYSQNVFHTKRKLSSTYSFLVAMLPLIVHLSLPSVKLQTYRQRLRTLCEIRMLWTLT